MESKRIYRDAPLQDIKLPREVFYRCLWTIRDAERLMMLAGILADERAFAELETILPHTDTRPDTGVMIVSDVTARQAESELRCIERAIGKIPSVYRKGLLDNIINKTPFDDNAHPNTWKRWKLVLLYELALELHMI